MGDWVRAALRAGAVGTGSQVRNDHGGSGLRKTLTLRLRNEKSIPAQWRYRALVDKGDKTNPNAQKMAETIIVHARPELLKYYPVALYKGETVSAENKPANPKLFKEPLTVELLEAHQKLVKSQNK